jgi:hypothetical protein
MIDRDQKRPLLPEERKLYENFTEMDKPREQVSGPFALMCRQTLALNDALTEALHQIEELRLRDKPTRWVCQSCMQDNPDRDAVLLRRIERCRACFTTRN